MTDDPKDYVPEYTDGEQPDLITHEETDDPTEELGVSPEKYAEELSHLDGEATGDETPEFEEDSRENIEDMDEADKDRE